MFKRFTAILLVLIMVLSLAACGEKKEGESSIDFKIGILTGTVSQNEEEYRAAEAVVNKYGEDNIVLMTYPDKFMDEQETTISNIVSMASNPDVKAIIIVQAVPGVSAGIEKAKEIRDDLLIIAGVPGEDPAMIAEKADIVLALDELMMGRTIIEQAKEMGATHFVHYSFPRHMSYALLSARRDLFKENCEALGLTFVDATAPDPTGDAGVPGAQQFILEDVPRMVAEYGKDTAFFSTNCSMQVPLIESILNEGALFPQPCCPSPTHGFPSALGIKIDADKSGDMPYIIEQITAAIKDKGMEGRLSTWSVPVSMMFIEAAAEYAIRWEAGETEGKLDMKVLREEFEAYAKTDLLIDTLEDGGVSYDNYLMIMLDFLTF